MLIFFTLIDDEEDKTSFQKVYESNCRVMMCMAMKILSHEQEAEDAVYEAFLALAEHYSKYKKRNNDEMRALCIIITKNKAMDILREKKRYSDEIIENMNLFESKEKQPENAVIADEQSVLLKHALCELPEILKSVLELKYFLGYSNKEIAEILGIQLKAVEMRLYRGKKKLREVLENETK